MTNNGSPIERRGAISRRQFLAVTAVAGGGVLLVVGPRLGRRVADHFRSQDASHDPNVFVKLLPDDTIVITSPKVDMGQGTRTALAMLIADELDADWDKVRIETAAFDAQYGNQDVVSSGSVKGRFNDLRQIGATARSMLVSAAARRWNVPASEITTERSVARHAKSGRTLTYGALADSLANERVPTNIPLKPRSSWRLIGTESSGKDVRDIARGAAIYGIDVRVPGMRFASIERTLIFGAGIASVDDAAALAVPGVLQIVRTPAVPAYGVHAGVAVVAENTWAALQGRRVLEVAWSPVSHPSESTESHRSAMRAALDATTCELVAKVGDPDALLARSSAVVRADYEVPFLAHATMEPMNCTAHARGDRAEIWSPTQLPGWAASAAAGALGIPTRSVTLHVPRLIGGGFGRRLNPDVTVEAALLSRQIHAPVQVLWTREDDLRHDFYRTCAMHRLEATIDADGWPVAWRHRTTTAAMGASPSEPASSRGHGASESVGSHEFVYSVPNWSREYVLLPSLVPRGSWRAVHATHIAFAVESFVDELANAAGKDPLEYRLALISRAAGTAVTAGAPADYDGRRLEAVLRLAGEKAGWTLPLPSGRAQGVACTVCQGTYIAEIVEASVDRGEVVVHRVIVAADCGTVINPRGARAQIEGGVSQALSAALKEKITIAGGAVEQGNFDSYQVLRMKDAPRSIDVFFVNGSEHPTGLGEPPVPPFAPALANAIARATGKRLRALPLDLSVVS